MEADHITPWSKGGKTTRFLRQTHFFEFLVLENKITRTFYISL